MIFNMREFIKQDKYNFLKEYLNDQSIINSLKNRIDCIGIVSAFRATESEEINIENSKILLDCLTESGYQFQKVEGHYKEPIVDENNNIIDYNDVIEESYFVINDRRTDSQMFRNWLVDLGNLTYQYSVIFRDGKHSPIEIDGNNQIAATYDKDISDASLVDSYFTELCEGTMWKFTGRTEDLFDENGMIIIENLKIHFDNLLKETYGYNFRKGYFNNDYLKKLFTK